MRHKLKTWPLHFEEVRAGRKTFEIRKYDRNYLAGDELALVEWDPDKEKYTGRSLEVRVVGILFANLGASIGLATGFVVMSIKRVCRGPRALGLRWARAVCLN